MDGELRFDCSSCWHIFVDDDVMLYQAKTEKGEVWKAKPREAGDTVVAALDVDEHVVLIKNTKTVGSKEEWTLRFAPGVEARSLKGARGQHICTVDPDESSILALKVKSPEATTVFIVSKNPPKELPARFELIGEEPPPATQS